MKCPLDYQLSLERRKVVICGLIPLASSCAMTMPPDAHIAKDLDASATDDGSASIAKQTPRGKSLYLFFVSTSETYSRSEIEDVMRSMRASFHSFGRSIGNDNLAIWSNIKGSSRLSARHGKLLVDQYHIHASRTFDYNKGPYLLITNIHPLDAAQSTFQPIEGSGGRLPADFVVGISFNGIAPNYVVEALNGLEQSIRRHTLSSTDTIRIETWLSFKTWWDQNGVAIGNFANQVFVAILGTIKKK